MDLAKEFNVSRATIRRATDLLVERGLIYRRQGIGSFVTHTPDIANPLNQFIDFREMLRKQGFRPGLAELTAKFVAPAPKVSDALDLDPLKLVLENSISILLPMTNLLFTVSTTSRYGCLKTS